MEFLITKSYIGNLTRHSNSMDKFKNLDENQWKKFQLKKLNNKKFLRAGFQFSLMLIITPQDLQKHFAQRP